MSNILLSMNFVITLLYLCCISCYNAQNAAISSALAPFELEAFQFSNENDSSNKYYLIWERPVYFLPTNYISHANIDKDANDLLLHQLTLPLPEETQPNQYQTAGNKPIKFRKNDQQSFENRTNSVNKGFAYKTHKIVNNKIGLFGDIQEYIIEYKQKDSEEASITKTVKADVTWFCLEDLLNNTFYSIYVSAKYSTFSARSAEFLLFTDENNSSKTNVCSCHSPGVEPGGEKCDLNSLEICPCRKGYTGLFCHQCKHFFYEKDGHCLSCPCKSKSSFFCTLVGEEPTCYCKKGYNGKNCDVCANGYFSYYYMCAKCMCNGNVDFNSPEICDPDTGACKHCLHNTTGFACDRCLPGYVGDPILHKNCTYEGFGRRKTPEKSHKLSGTLIFVLVLVCFLLVFLSVCLYYRRICTRVKRLNRNQQKEDQASIKFIDMNNQEFDDGSNIACSSGFRIPGQQRDMQYSPLKECL